MKPERVMDVRIVNRRFGFYPERSAEYRRVAELMPARSAPSHVRIDGDVAYVELTHGMVAIIDADDAWLIGKLKWSARKSRRTYYADTCLPGTKGDSPRIQMHRLIMPHAERNTDHINCNGLDNRKSNLRVATTSQNGANNKWATGASFHLGAWRAALKVRDKKLHLGTFPSFEAAHAAYLEAKRKHFVEYANTESIALIPEKPE